MPAFASIASVASIASKGTIATIASRAIIASLDSRRAKATIPSSVELERATNLFVRASSPEQLAELRLSKDHWPS